MYDEHGGYYDHVRTAGRGPARRHPARRRARAGRARGVEQLRPPGPGVRHLAVRQARNYVSHVVHDHTSVLRFIETKFNLGALTRRDANASNLLDCFDFRARDPRSSIRRRSLRRACPPPEASARPQFRHPPPAR